MVDFAAGYLRPYQRELIESPERFLLANWSRQTGKDEAGSLRRTLRGIRRKKNQIVLSASMRQTLETMARFRKHLEAMRVAFSTNEFDLDPFDGMKLKATEFVLPEVPMRIIGLPANPYTARGFTGDVWFNEFAMHRHSEDIWASAFPSVTACEGEIDITSTPNGRQNMFYRVATGGSFAVQTVSIHDAIRDGLRADAEELRKACANDEKWRQEFLCEFVDEATAFLTYEQIAECEQADLGTELDVLALRNFKGDVVVGIDVARKGHLTVIWPFRVEDRQLTSLGLIEIHNMPFSEQYERFKEIIAIPCVRRTCIDASGLGMETGENLAKHFGEGRVEPCTFTPLFKASIANAMRNRFTDRLIRIPVSEKIRHDLHSVTRTVTEAGNVRLSSPKDEGSHADRFWACALAVHAASTDLGPMEFMPGTPGPCGSEKLRMRGGDDW